MRMILNPYHYIVEMRYFSEMRIYFKAHFALLSDAQYCANTSNALKCCNRFTHNRRSNGNLAHKATLPLKLQYHNPAKSSFMCVSAIHPPSPLNGGGPPGQGGSQWSRVDTMGEHYVQPPHHFVHHVRTSGQHYVDRLQHRSLLLGRILPALHQAMLCMSNLNTLLQLFLLWTIFNNSLIFCENQISDSLSGCTEGRPAKMKERKAGNKMKNCFVGAMDIYRQSLTS